MSAEAVLLWLSVIWLLYTQTTGCNKECQHFYPSFFLLELQLRLFSPSTNQLNILSTNQLITMIFFLFSLPFQRKTFSGQQIKPMPFSIGATE